MPIILVCGERHSGYTRARDVLRAAGLVDAKHSKREDYSPEDLGRGICEAYDIDPDDPAKLAQVEPGKVWQALSIDLALGNLGGGDWGWADPNLVYMLDHWRDFDPQVKFVLVYSSPEETIARLISDEEPTPERIRAALALWEAYNGELLRFYYANKERCLLVNSTVVDSNATLLAGLARDHLKARKLTDTVDLSSVAPAPSPTTDLVASWLASDAEAAHLLFRELESTADLPGRGGADPDAPHRALHNLVPAADGAAQPVSRDSILRVWSEFRDMRDRLEASERTARAGRKELFDIRQEKELLLLHLAQLQAEIEETYLGRQEREDELQAERATAAARADEIAALGEQNRQARDRVDELEAQIERAWARVGELEHETDALRRQSAMHAGGEDRADDQGRRIKELSTENGLLVLQLQQLQEELETYFLKYQDLAARGTAPEVPAPSGAPRLAAVGAATVDLRGLVDGDNWHYAEVDGRWSGPGAVSTLKLPRLIAGCYRLELDIVDSMSPSILRGLEVRAGGRLLKLDGIAGRSWLPFGRKRKRKLKYPLTVTATVTLPNDADVVLEFKVPQTISPSSRGSADERQLGFRMRQVTMSRQ